MNIRQKDTLELYILTKNRYAFFPNRNDRVVFYLTRPDGSKSENFFSYSDINKLTGRIDISLDEDPGEYQYEVKLLRKSPWNDEPDIKGTWETIIPKTKLNII